MMRGKKSGVIGVVASASVLYTSVIRLQAVAQAIHAHGYAVLVSELLWSRHSFERAISNLIDAQVEGILLTSVSRTTEYGRVIKRLFKFGLPVVSLGNTFVEGVPLIKSDYFQGMRDVTNHALSRGCKKLAFLTIKGRQSDGCCDPGFSERLKGFQSAVLAAGSATEDIQILREPPGKGFDSFSPGRTGMQRLLAAKRVPHALMCSNDDIALGALNVCIEAGLRVPGDIAITGFDNSPITQHLAPALTTVAQPAAQCGKKAVDMLVETIREREKLRNNVISFPCQVIPRASC